MLTDDIVTPRLMLRSTREAWGPLCVEIWLDEEMGKYLADPPRDKAGRTPTPISERGSKARRAGSPSPYFPGRAGNLSARAVWCPTEEGGCWDLGYAVHKRFWRRGYCTEMLTALMDWGRREGVRSFTAKVARENTGLLRRTAEAWLPCSRGGQLPKAGRRTSYTRSTLSGWTSKREAGYRLPLRHISAQAPPLPLPGDLRPQQPGNGGRHVQDRESGHLPAPRGNPAPGRKWEWSCPRGCPARGSCRGLRGPR